MTDGDRERLETGYGPNAPVGDNIANDFTRETADSYRALAESRGDRVHRIAGVITMTDSGLPLPFWNRAVLEQPVEHVDELVAILAGFYGPDGPPFLLDSTWPLPDLRGRGFQLMGHPPLMVRAGGTPLPPAPADLRVERVCEAEAATDLERTLVDGYPAPPLQPFTGVRMLTPGAIAAPGWHHFVGYADGQPVAAGSSYVGATQLRVENIATLSDARGRGFGLAITAATIAVDPDRTATLVASDLGRPIYEKLGFVAMARCDYWLGLRGAIA